MRIDRLGSVICGLLAVAMVVGPAWCRAGACCSVSVMADRMEDVGSTICPHCTHEGSLPDVPAGPGDRDRCNCSQTPVVCVTTSGWRLTESQVAIGVADVATVGVLPSAKANDGQPRLWRATPGRLLCYSNGVLRC